MHLSSQGRLLLTLMEGKRSRIYQDATGADHIGIGHLIHPHELQGFQGRDLSHGEIQVLLTDDLYPFEAAILEACLSGGVIPTQAQFDAFILLAFNIGLGGTKVSGFLTSTVFRRFINRDNAGAAAAFLMWNKITVTDRETGKRKRVASRALEARRIAESRVFLHAYYDETPYDALDDEDKIKAMTTPSNSPANPTNVVASESEARPTLKSSRTMKATTAGQAGSGVVTAAATVGVVKSVADGAKEAADSAGAAVKSVTEAAEVTGEAASIFSNVSLWIYGFIGAGALVAIIAFILVRRARRDDWRRGLR